MGATFAGQNRLSPNRCAGRASSFRASNSDRNRRRGPADPAASLARRNLGKRKNSALPFFSPVDPECRRLGCACWHAASRKCRVSGRALSGKMGLTRPVLDFMRVAHAHASNSGQPIFTEAHPRNSSGRIPESPESLSGHPKQSQQALLPIVIPTLFPFGFLGFGLRLFDLLIELCDLPPIALSHIVQPPPFNFEMADRAAGSIAPLAADVWVGAGLAGKL